MENPVSFTRVWKVVGAHRRLVLGVVCGLMALCLLYCLVAPNQYDARARVALRTAPSSALTSRQGEALAASSILSAPIQQETVANVLRSDQLAWKTILAEKLYAEPAFAGRFATRFADFRPEAPTPAAQQFLLDRFSRRLTVASMPRSLTVEIRFRTRSAELSARVANALVRGYQQQETASRMEATLQASDWMRHELESLKARMEADERRLADFQRQNQILSTPETLSNGQQGETEHSPAITEVDALGRQLVEATTERIEREAVWKAAQAGDPELVLTGDARLEAEDGGVDAVQLKQWNARRADLAQEMAQLSAEHGPNFPRVVEIRQQLADLDAEKKTEDARLLDRFKKAFETASTRETMIRRSLDATADEGRRSNEAAARYMAMRQEANSSQQVYTDMRGKLEDAGLAAGIGGSAIVVIDPALPPAKPAAPNPPLYLAVTLFLSLWLALGAAFLMETLNSMRARAALLLIAALAAGFEARAQAPTPNTSGLPAGVTRLPQTQERHQTPNPREAPQVWNQPDGPQAGSAGTAGAGMQMPAPIGPGDLLDITEVHTPEFHTAARVSPTGTVVLPMVDEVQLLGLDERSAAHAIEQALIAKGMLLHPQVSVLVTAYAGQDVSVLGEVARPGVYPFTTHHRLLDLISAAQGLSASAGRLVNIFHRGDPRTAHPVVLDPGGTEPAEDHNPELEPGDTVQVSRAGLVYVIGDVVRPGGFAVDPAQGLTVVQALSLAWGPAQNAATGRALLIREQKGGRTLTELNLKKMLHGQEPDQPVHDRDILYIPDSTAKNLLNRTAESIIQSAVGVSIYSALVYSQRY